MVDYRCVLVRILALQAGIDFIHQTPLEFFIGADQHVRVRFFRLFDGAMGGALRKIPAHRQCLPDDLGKFCRMGGCHAHA